MICIMERDTHSEHSHRLYAVTNETMVRLSLQQLIVNVRVFIDHLAEDDLVGRPN